MAKKKSIKKEHTATAEERIKTSVALRPSLWRAARVRALMEGRPANELLEAAVRLYLKTTQKEVR